MFDNCTLIEEGFAHLHLAHHDISHWYKEIKLYQEYDDAELIQGQWNQSSKKCPSLDF